MDNEYNLTISQVARELGVYRLTVINYEKRGLLTPMRDMNNHRRYAKEDITKLKQLIEMRRPADN